MSVVEGALVLASKITGKIVPSIFPFGQVVKLVRSGYKITNSTNPLTVTTNITLTVLECCAPPPLRLAVTCVAFTASLASSVMAPNPVSLGATVHFIGEIYDKC